MNTINFKAKEVPNLQLPPHLKHSIGEKVARVALSIFTLGLYPLISCGMNILARMSFLPQSRLKRAALNKEIREQFLTHYPKQAQSLKIQTSDGAILDAMAVHPTDQPSQTQKWIIFCLGIGEKYEDLLITAMNYSEETNSNLLFFNYRGVNESKGKASKALDLVVDGEACVQYLISKGVSEKNMILHGHSLGGGVAAEIGYLHKECPKLEDKTFASLSKAIKYGPFLPKFLRRIAAFMVKFFKWNLKTAKYWSTMNAKNCVITNYNDGIVTEKASLITSLKKKSKFNGNRNDFEVSLNDKEIPLKFKYFDKDISLNLNAHSHSIYYPDIKKNMALCINMLIS